MKTLKLTTLILSAFIVMLSPVQSQAGSRDVRVRAKVRPAHLAVELKSINRTGNSHFRVLKKDRSFVNLSSRDRKMARRLAQYSGLSSKKILNLRARGFRWSEIAFRLDLPRQVVRAAASAKSWNKFMKPHHWCGTRNH